MKLYHRYLLYQRKWISPYLQGGMRVLSLLTAAASLLLLFGLAYEYGFDLTEEELSGLSGWRRLVWVIFLVDVSLRLVLQHESTKRQVNLFSRLLIVALYLTLLPVVFHRPEVEGATLHFYDVVSSHGYRLTVMTLFALLSLSKGALSLLGRRTNPSLILAVSFLIFIAVGTGLLLLPRCTVDGIGWTDSLFVATSAVCVTGLSTVDVPSTFTPAGMAVIAFLVQIGGLGVMTFTSFFALFFMGNTSLYNQMVVRDMVSSNSINSLLSTMAYILGFTLVIEAIGMLAIWAEVHGTLGMSFQDELAFAAFHSVSAFCNAGFSSVPNGLGNDLLMTGHNSFYLTISVLVILGGIGFPILVNFKDIVVYHLRRLYHLLVRGQHDGRRFRHLYNLNTRIVLLTTAILLVLTTTAFAIFEWNHAFAGLPVVDKLTQAFFNAVCPRTAGFNSFDLSTFGLHTLLIYMLMMWIGGGAQSIAGGIKVNAFAVVVLNLVALLRGTDRVEAFGREISPDSIRRSNATVIMAIGAVFVGFFILSLLEPEASRLGVAFECVSALSTAGSSLGLTPTLAMGSKWVVVVMMFMGRVGMITLLMGIVRQKKRTKYRYPGGQIIIN